MQRYPRSEKDSANEAFGLWLRTGRWVPAQLVDPTLEVKFNPNHDPRDGRFTFATGGGNGTGFRPASRREPQTDAEKAGRSSDSSNPRNHSLHRVKSGETLTRIAGLRKGLTASDLAWLNGIAAKVPLRIGQAIKLPHQAFLDRGRDARNKFLALSLYLDTHDGHLPPDPLHPPSVEEQTLGPATWHDTAKNGYIFAKDPINRTRQVTGTISNNSSQGRSKIAQARAGGSDRLPTDQGGHYIARRFNGPTDAFNHFAQDAHFNQSRYRKLENLWSAESAKGHPVWAKITPEFVGIFQRPSIIIVEYKIGKETHTRRLINQREKQHER